MTSTPFRDCLQAPGAFAIAVELVTARGVVTTERSRALVEKARALLPGDAEVTLVHVAPIDAEELAEG